MKQFLLLIFFALSALMATAQNHEVTDTDVQHDDSVSSSHVLDDVTVKAPTRGRLTNRITNTEQIGQAELVRAACCNLGESFTTNPSVDVSYSDAATGARQIKLLGLSGTYVQMLTENMPNLRGASIPYSLGYVPGPWLQSIQVSKGASSVKSGYESITGQINIEYLKPQGTDGVRANAYLDNKLKQEEAWNTGASLSFNIPVAGKELELNIDYYYTDFDNQMVLNPYTFNNENKYSIENLSGKSYSHTAQIDATYPFFEGFTATGAYRYTEAKTTYDGMLLTRPLTSRYKGLLTLGYKTPLELWHFDVTGSVNGPGHLYDRSLYHAYFQLQAQITREFRYFSVYVGGENLTNYTISDPIRSAADPWSAMFDATQVWGPTEGAMFYIGMRFKLEKM